MWVLLSGGSGCDGWGSDERLLGGSSEQQSCYRTCIRYRTVCSINLLPSGGARQQLIARVPFGSEQDGLSCPETRLDDERGSDGSTGAANARALTQRPPVAHYGKGVRTHHRPGHPRSRRRGPIHLLRALPRQRGPLVGRIRGHSLGLERRERGGREGGGK